MKNVWFMIPARAGSKAIPKKNIRLLAGKPLVSYVLESVSSVTDREHIVVSTDDAEIKELAAPHALVHNRSKSSADDQSTLDEVALEVAKFLKKEHGADEDDILVTVQPTSPFIRPDTIRKAVEKQRKGGSDTVLTVKDDRHLRWTMNGHKPEPLYEKRVNRQQMKPVFSETGGIILTTIEFLIENGTRIGEEVSLLEVDEKEGLDIDTYADWALAEYWMNKLQILIRVDGRKKIGYGHLYRALAIAQNIHSHEVIFVTRSDNDYRLGKNFLEGHHFPIIEIQSNKDFLKELDVLDPDIVINDILDTEKSYIEDLKSRDIFVVNLEDLGEGSHIADLVINDLYPGIFPQENHWYGVEYAILNPNFERVEPRSEPGAEVNNVLLAFGGTDPSNLTVKALNALLHIGYEGNVTVVIGPGHSRKEQVTKLAQKLNEEAEVLQDVKNMATVMRKNDLALTSAGRTVTELMTMGVPTIAISQNMREMRHDHASSSYGVVNLGLGRSITSEALGDHIKMFISDQQLRVDMYNRMRKAVSNRSNSAVVSKIVSAYKNSNKSLKTNGYS